MRNEPPYPCDKPHVTEFFMLLPHPHARAPRELHCTPAAQIGHGQSLEQLQKKVWAGSGGTYGTGCAKGFGSGSGPTCFGMGSK